MVQDSRELNFLLLFFLSLRACAPSTSIIGFTLKCVVGARALEGTFNFPFRV